MIARRWRVFAFMAAAGAVVMACSSGSNADFTPNHGEVAREAQASPFERAEVHRDGNGMRISWIATGVSSVQVYAGSSPEGARIALPVGKGEARASLEVRRLPFEGRAYFKLVPDTGKPLIVADRALHLASAPNFRDVGGLRTLDGRWVRMGRLYRSGDLSSLAPGDSEELQELGIRLVCDLRTDAERQASPDRVPPHAEVLIADVSKGRDIAAAPDKEMLRKLGTGPLPLVPLYREYVSSDAARAAYHLLYARLADPRALPGVVHCSAGKDRTGWAVAALLDFLGVPREAIIADYMASNDFLAPQMAKYEARITDPELRAMLPRFANHREYIEAAFAEMDRRYGDARRYFAEGLGLTGPQRESLRRNFLE